MIIVFGYIADGQTLSWTPEEVEEGGGVEADNKWSRFI